jgi:predicted ribosome quality control (RQC) complex YloA/Tae2 family protein
MSLVAEIMGRHSNIIFLNENGKILDAMIHVDHTTSRVREILPARQYMAPPLQDKRSIHEALDANGSDILFAEEKDMPIAKSIVNGIKGFSPLLAGELCHMASIDPKAGIRSLTPEDRHQLRAALHALIRVIDSNIAQPSLIYLTSHAQDPYDFHALTMTSFPRCTAFDSLSDAMDAFYRSRNRHSALQQKKNHLLRLAEKKLENISRKIAVHQQDLTDCNGYEQLKLPEN